MTTKNRHEAKDKHSSNMDHPLLAGQVCSRAQEIERLNGFATALIEAAPVPLIAFDKDCKIIHLNPPAAKMLGWDQGERRGCPLLFSGPDERESFLALHRRVVEGETVHGAHIKITAADGRVIEISISAAPMVDSRREIMGATAVLKDVTARRQQDREAKLAPSLLRATLNSTTDGVLIVDLDGKIISHNKQFARMWGIPEDVLDTGDDDKALAFVLEQLKDPDGFLRKVRELYAEPDRESVDFLEFKDGRVFERYSTPQEIDGQTVGRVWSFRDMTEKSGFKSALRKSEEKYRHLVENSRECICHLALDGCFLYMSPAGLRAHGLTLGDVVKKHFLELTDEKYHQLAKMMFARARAGDAVKFEYESHTFNGQHWFESSLAPIRDESNRIVSILRLSRDITEHKQAEQALADSFDKLKATLEESVNALSTLAEKRDPYTAGHQQRVARLACAIAESMGMAPQDIEGLRVAAALHDIGKIHIPAEILSKPSSLSYTEMSLIKTHPEVGFEILTRIPFSQPVARIVLQHHERLNGTGYPHGLPGEAILAEARILAVADVVEAIASHRPYRPALGIGPALKEVSGQRGLLYDADVVDACLALFHKRGFEIKNS